MGKTPEPSPSPVQPVPVDNQKYILVGDQKIPVTDAEYFFACCDPGTPVEWGGGRSLASLFGNSEGEGAGVFVRAMNYDGIMARVLVGGKEVLLHPYQKGFWAKRLEDTSRLEGQGLNGDGI